MEGTMADTTNDTTNDETNDDVTESNEPPDDGSSGAISPDEVLAGGSRDEAGVERKTESVNEPARVLRIGSMVKQLLDEVRSAPLDEKSRVRLREIYEQSIHELSEGLSPDLVAELDRMALPFDSGRAERLRAAHRGGSVGGMAGGLVPRDPSEA